VRITRVSTAVVEANFEWTFVRVETDADVRGLGECFLAPGLTAIIRQLAPLLEGEDARDVDRLWGKLRWATSGAGSAAGVVYNAISGIEAALLDATARFYGAPLYQLLGGRQREKVRVYADCHAGDALEAMDAVLVPRRPSWAQAPVALSAQEGGVLRPVHGRAHGDPEGDESFSPAIYASRAREVVAEQGFTALKFDLDVPNPHMRDTVSGTLGTAEISYLTELVAAVRDAVGDEVELAFDCHWRYQVSDAQRLAHELEPFRLMWLEDPVPPENLPALARVTQSTRTPIATGENLYLRHGFREALETGALDVAAPDLQKTGGLLEARRIADLADTHYVSVAPHCIASPIGTMASAHVATAIPNFLALEWHGMSVPFWEELATGLDRPVIEAGHIVVPDAPGLGVELDEEVARRYAKPGEPFFDEG
jgi:gluconate/galactonate dehydratase